MTDRLTASDAAWLYMEAPERPMNVSQLQVLDAPGGVARGDLQALVAGRLGFLPRLRQRVALPPGPADPPMWADDAAFDLDAHLHETPVAEPGGPAELAGAASAVHVRPLDPARPLWEVHVLRTPAGSTPGVLVKWHHALADAMAGLAMVRRLLETRADAPAEPAAEWDPRPVPESFELIGGATGTHGADALERLRRAASDPAGMSGELRAAYLALESLLASGSPPGPFRRSAAPERRVALATLPFAEVRAARVELGTSTTAFVLSLIAGALSRLLGVRDVDAGSLRVMVPVLAKGARGRPESGNHAAYRFFDLPVGAMDEHARLRQVVDRLAAARRAGDPGDGRGGADLVVTYLIGPLGPVDIVGAPLRSAHSVVPTGSSIPLGVATVSMGDTMGITFTGDAAQFPDINGLATGLSACYGALRAAAGAAQAP